MVEIGLWPLVFGLWSGVCVFVVGVRYQRPKSKDPRPYLSILNDEYRPVGSRLISSTC